MASGPICGSAAGALRYAEPIVHNGAVILKEPGRLKPIERLRGESCALWHRATVHPFIEELGAGTLPVEKFRRYFVQDYLFVGELAKVAGLLTAKAPDVASARPFGEFLSNLLGAEDNLFLRAFEAMGTPDEEFRNAEPLPTTSAFGNYLTALAYSGTFREMCCAMYVVEGVYLDWADRLTAENARPADSGHPLGGLYQEWIDIHADEALGPFVRSLESQVNGASPGELPGLQVIFNQVARYEAAFWEMAYRGEEWP